MLTDISTLRATWVCPEDGDYSLYGVRDGSVTEIEPDVCYRCMFKNMDDDEADFEVIIRSLPDGMSLMLDYDSAPTSLLLTEFRSGESSIFVHDSTQHKIYLRPNPTK